MNIPKELKYTESHEWAKEVGGLFEIGLSDYAQHELGDLVFVNLPQPGDALTAGSPFADVESVKAVADINSPVTGTVKEVNDAVMNNAALINEDCYGSWLIKAEGTLGSVMDAAAYEKTLPAE
jgi:glycine cleavage system H protein